MQHPSAPATAAPNTSSILEALANMARQNTTAPAATANVPAPTSSYNMLGLQSNHGHQTTTMNPPLPFPPSTQSVNVPASAATFALQPPGPSNSAQSYPSNPAMPFGAAPPAPPQDQSAALQQQILIFKTLADQGIPQEQWAGIIAALNAVQGTGVGTGAVGSLAAAQVPTTQNQNVWGARPEESRDRNGFPEPVRSPPGRFRRRSRSPSPTRAWGARDSPSSRRRDEPGYGDYDRGRDSPGRDRARARGNEYRQRSPPGRRGRSPSPPPHMARGEKWVDFDPTIGKENIKGIQFVSTDMSNANNIFYSFEPYSIRWWCHVS